MIVSQDGRGRARRALLAVLALVALVLAACGGGNTGAGADPDGATDGGTDGGGEATGEVTVGFISPVTGFVAALGTDMRRGWELYWELNGDTAGGVKVRSVFEDDTGDPEVALTKARRLVEEEDVDLVAGPILANTAYAVADYVAGQGIPTLQITGADDLTQRRHDPLVLRVGYTSSQSNMPAGDWAAQQGHQTAVTICPDYAFGWESCGGFVTGFTNGGGEVIEQIWHPLGTQDFSTYVGQIQRANPDVVFVGSAGGPDAILLYTAWNDFGLKEQIPLIGNCCFADQVFMRDVGDIALGVESFTYWAEGRDSQAVQDFVSAYEERHGEIPSLYAAGSYMMAEVTAAALEETGGVIDGEDFIAAARGLTLEDSLYGPISFDEYNNIVGPVYHTRIEERDDGTLWNVPQQTFEDVSQFWTFDPEEFLANPVFSRDFQLQQ